MTITKHSLLASASTLMASSISNAGGEGKTTIAIAVDAALALLGQPAHLIDVDQGMGSLSYQRKDTKTLDWGEPPEKAEVVFKRLQDRNVVFDFGANTLASGAPVVRLYWKLCELFDAAGFRRDVFVPISTNKPGAVGAAKEIMRTCSHMNCHAVLVNRDGSNRYDEDVSMLSAIAMPHLAPALQEFRSDMQQKGLSLADLLRDPPAGWVHAVDYLGMWLREFAIQPKMIEILGGDIGPVLDQLGRRTRPTLRIRNLSVDHLHDNVIGDMVDLGAFSSLVQRGGIWRVLYAHGLTPAGLRAAADELEKRASN